MIMICQNCRTEADINYSLEDEVAVCSLCEGTFEVNEFQKKMLIETRSIIRKSSKRGFMFACMNCSVEREVILKDGKAVCKQCGGAIPLPPSMLNALKVKVDLDNDGREVTDRPAIQYSKTTGKKTKKTKRAKKKGKKKKANK